MLNLKEPIEQNVEYEILQIPLLQVEADILLAERRRQIYSTDFILSIFIVFLLASTLPITWAGTIPLMSLSSGFIFHAIYARLWAERVIRIHAN